MALLVQYCEDFLTKEINFGLLQQKSLVAPCTWKKNEKITNT